MAILVVRDVDDSIVKALQVLADRRGASAEIEHRRILAHALRKPNKKSFAELLTEIPRVGKDLDFRRVED